ncbi:MAG: LysR family transcriptional regulator [Pseudomonadota bacterium]
MEVKDIELIHAVHETGSLSQACIALNMSQPTLSKKLARLEQTLGSTLFHRYPRGLAATAVAQYILSKAAPLRAELAEIERHVQLMTELEAGRLNLGVGPIIEQVMLPEVLRAFVESTGDVELSIVTEDEPTLLSMFNASELDVVVGPFDVNEHTGKNRISIPMISDRIIAAARPYHPVFSKTAPELNELLRYSWVAPKTQGTVKGIDGHPIFKKMKVLSDNYTALKTLTCFSDAICAGPRAVFKSELELNQLREIKLPFELIWTSALLVKPETYATPLARHLVSLFESFVDEQKL